MSVNPIQLASISPILERYELFLVDIAGVLHNGVQPYAGAIEALKVLQGGGRHVILFSNAPRPGDLTIKKLEEMGFYCSKLDILTSGDHFINNVKQHNGQLTYILGADKNIDYNWRQYLTITNDIHQAKYLLILEYADSLQSTYEHDYLLDAALKQNIEVLCPNPDRLVYHGASLRYPAGHFAFQYQQMGGKVHYYGKPHLAFYEQAIAMHPCAKEKILAIGDNLDTDIQGANNFGIDSLLIMGGIFREYNASQIEITLPKCAIQASYVAASFRL